ncbi:hypothetical protein EPN44_01505 [bacterium]|nr:MAG: hypothetical protein EPN44_01505 [bacterium]
MRTPLPTVLFVCTGNTCRSPMAAALFEAYARRAGREDVRAESAGISAREGLSAAAEAHRALDGVASLASHRARRVDAPLVERADLVVGLTRDHALRLRAIYPSAASRIISFADLPGGANVSDPYLLEQPVYDQTRRHLERLFPVLLAELDHRAARARRKRIRGEGEGKSGA